MKAGPGFGVFKKILISDSEKPQVVSAKNNLIYSNHIKRVKELDAKGREFKIIINFHPCFQINFKVVVLHDRSECWSALK